MPRRARAHCDDPNGGPRRDRRPVDAGFTFLELLIALTILLFSVVAITGVMMTSAALTTTARQKSAMVNAASGYLERARQQAFGDIGTPGGDPDGILVSVTTTSGPYVLTVTPTVTWGRAEDPTNHAFKTLTVSVSSVGGGSTGTYTSSAIIGATGVVTPGAPTAEATPTVEIVSPSAGSALWGASASITASANTNTAARTIASLGLYDGGSVLGLVVASGQTASRTFTWNTTTAREGQHALTPRATDSSGRSTDGTATTFLVDNAAPGAPTSLSIVAPNGSSTQVWWTASQDGTAADGTTPLLADHYVTAAWQQPSSTALAAAYTSWTSLPTLSLSVITAPSSSAPMTFSGLGGFQRFAVAVQASSPDRGAASGLLSSAAVVTGITRPTLGGTWTATKSGKNYSISASMNIASGPGFPWSGTATTSFYRLTSAAQAYTSGTLLRSVSSTNPSWGTVTAADTQSATSNPVRYWYVAVTTITPQGYGAAATTLQSCVIGPGTATSTGTMAVAGW